jgi:ribosome biogenesis GTPase
MSAGNQALHATVISHYGNEILICDEFGQRHRATVRQDLAPLVCGDKISYQKTEFNDVIITQVEERHGTLTRSTPYSGTKLIAANIDLALVVCSHKPKFNSGLLDRYLAACELSKIDVEIIFNKTDTLNAKDSARVKSQLNYYETIGYPVYFVSAKQNQGLTELKLSLQNKNSVLVGQSGVGKSSIIRALVPSANPRVADVSDKTQKGRHTTTTSELYLLDEHSYVIDSPGIREFGLGYILPEQLADGFKEFQPFLGQCKFRDCIHTNEPGCAVITAVEAGEISQARFDSYRNILSSLSD